MIDYKSRESNMKEKNVVCGKLNVDDIIACSLSLKKSEFRLFKELMILTDQVTVIELAEKLNLDRTTVQKIIKSFMQKGLVTRYQENLDNGGYLFLYAIKDKEKIRAHIKKMLATWYDLAIKSIEETN
jgi:predicted transcriptional regulator